MFDVKKINGYYVLTLALLVAMVFISLRYFGGSRHLSIGICSSKEYKVTSERSTLINKVHVVPGQMVKAGQALLDITSQGLDFDIEKLMAKMEALGQEIKGKAKLLASEEALVATQYDLLIGSIDADMAKINSNMELNRQLTREFTESKGDSNRKSKNPLQLELLALMKKKNDQLQAKAIKIKDLHQEFASEKSLLENQLALQKQELNMLMEEKRGLNKIASSDGVVENVYVKEGEQVEAFAPLLTINPLRPTKIVAYLLGRSVYPLPVGAKVSVTDYDSHRHVAQGTVIGYGAVTQLPEILQKPTAVKAFGREVFIEIPPDNEFANGEKVLIR